jgi:1-acyl-sn-glycerol-3-phosphate acyltransferase
VHNLPAITYPNIIDLSVHFSEAMTLGKLKINIFGAIFALWEVSWGIVFWYPMLMLYAFARKISSMLPGDILGKKIDPFRRIPINVGYIWGLLSMTIFRMWPKIVGIENLDVLREVDENGKKGKLKPAMYVANHSSWMDIPFVCYILGFQNYKFIAKAELKKVPILGRALMVAGHVALDRTNRKSQMVAYKSGVQWLKDGVNLVTFPEGTRSKTGRMGSFKKGAFKMAQAVGAPIVPLSIHYADKVQPLDYAFPAKSSRSRPEALVKVGKPISTEGKTDDELLEEVWKAIATDLPESHKPAADTPVGAN